METLKEFLEKYKRENEGKEVTELFVGKDVREFILQLPEWEEIEYGHFKKITI